LIVSAERQKSEEIGECMEIQLGTRHIRPSMKRVFNHHALQAVASNPHEKFNIEEPFCAEWPFECFLGKGPGKNLGTALCIPYWHGKDVPNQGFHDPPRQISHWPAGDFSTKMRPT
jgi:hypothetical protein